MDAGVVSALAALSGSIIGGVTSLAASLLSHNVQARAEQAAADKTRRQDLYKAFIEEASRLYGDALANDKGEIGTIVGLYAMVSRMRIMSGPQVVDSADKVIRLVIDTYFAPNETLRELREAIKTTNVDPLREFSDACREDLGALRPA
jgi:hypothetical protein